MAIASDRRKAVLSLLDPHAKPLYTPAAFFLHFGSEFHSGRPAIDKHLEFFKFTGMDFAKIQLELAFPSLQFSKPGDWSKVPVLDAAFFEPQTQVVRGIVDALGSEALVVLTLYSPLMIAANIGGAEVLNRHMEEDLDPVRVGLERITDGLIGFVRECVKAGVDGFYHSTQGGESKRFSDPTIFEKGVKPYDLEVMHECERNCRFNILHICDYHRAEYGGYDDLTQFFDYPGHVVNCSLEGLNPDIISSMFHRPFMGGMERKGVLATGSIGEVRTAAREALAEASDRFILGADCTVPGDTPWENLKAAVDEAHSWEC